jgi:hypothetical protein
MAQNPSNCAISSPKIEAVFDHPRQPPILVLLGPRQTFCHFSVWIRSFLCSNNDPELQYYEFGGALKPEWQFMTAQWFEACHH